MSAPSAARPGGSGEPAQPVEPADPVEPRTAAPSTVRWIASRIGTFCVVEMQKLRHDRSELVTRAIQPALWLLIFGKTFTELRAVPTEGLPYLDFLAPGVLAQSTLFVAVFYGIQVIWERDAGVLAKLLVTPTPRSAIVAGKGFAAGIRALVQVVVVVALAAALGVHLQLAPWRLLGAAVVAVVGAAFFATLSMTIAGLVLSRDRLMGIGQAIMMPLFFASNALYPTSAMPGWIRWFAHINPLSYEVDALRGLLLGTDAHLWLDVAVLAGSLVAGVAVAAAVLPRLVR